MFYPVIWLRDKDIGAVRRFGESAHDRLTVDPRTGQLIFYNLQTSASTHPRSTYEFVNTDTSEFVPPLLDVIYFEEPEDLVRKEKEREALLAYLARVDAMEESPFSDTYTCECE